MTEELKQAFAALAAHTRPICMSGGKRSGDCRAPGSCCSPEYCEMAMEIAKNLGEPLQLTGHARLPLMGPGGCVAPPHVRPLCTMHVCCINSFGFHPSDKSWTNKYFQLRLKVEHLVCMEEADAH
jgi:hypothetical protein